MADPNTTMRRRDELREQDEEIEFEQDLERERFLQAERIRKARDDADANAMQEEIVAQEKEETGRSVGKVDFLMMLTVAIISDITLALIALVPYVGWIINGLLSLFVFLTFFTWFKMKGITYTSARKMAALPAGFLIELIPIVNILPGWTVAVILNTQGDKINTLVPGAKTSTPRTFKDRGYTPLQPGKASLGALNLQAKQATQQGFSVRPDFARGGPSQGKEVYVKTPTGSEAILKFPSQQEGFVKKKSAQETIQGTDKRQNPFKKSA